MKRAKAIYSASDPRAHFGVGQAERLDLVEVLWPGGQQQEFRGLEVNRHYLVDEEGGISGADFKEK